jgi:pantetheine-phosphate adenylyltransferase
MNFDNTINKPTRIISYALCNMERKAVYPGSFDPITNGHVDIIERGLKIFDRIVIAVLENPKKQPLFSTKERVRMIEDIFLEQKRIEVKAFDGLLVDFVRKNDATIVIRGLRAISDFEYEFQMTLMNRKLNPDIETLFMMPSISYSFLSSNLVKEVSMLGGSLSGLVPAEVENKLKKSIQRTHL